MLRVFNWTYSFFQLCSGYFKHWVLSAMSATIASQLMWAVDQKNPSIPQTKINKYRCEMVRFVAIQMGCRSFSREKTSIFGWISQPARFDFREGIPWRHRPISCSCSCMAGPTTATPTKQSHYDVAACMRTPIMRPIEIRRSPQRKQIRQRTEF